MSRPSSPLAPPAVVVDANVLISVCSNEPTLTTAAGALAAYALAGSTFYAPGIVVAEVLYVLCVKVQSNVLSPTQYDNAIVIFEDQMKAISLVPHGDASLIGRAKEIQAGYGCSRSADGLYIALAEALTKLGPAELVTFDRGIVNQSAKHATGVKVNLLPI
ncbi:MAG TPA: type II toxin-antitoxin system VapC family toxin [Blastocatellia bacterium]